MGQKKMKSTTKHTRAVTRAYVNRWLKNVSPKSATMLAQNLQMTTPTTLEQTKAKSKPLMLCCSSSSSDRS
eukprot:3444969-Amphidinium_carterae.1